jgi:glycosyltransferase involved in cell wall biosynthesis
MKARRIAKKVGGQLPISKGYLQKRELQAAVRLQSDEIIGLKQSVKRLEDRNEEWAAEVRALRGDAETLHVLWPVTPEDIIAADWTKAPGMVKPRKVKAPLTINWVVPPMGSASGGHADIFRTIHYLESKGHTCNVYFYDALQNSSLETMEKNLKNYTSIKAKLFYNAKTIADGDVIFATNWYTAYPVFNHRGHARKYYYVQDFEPYFEPSGAYSALAENTYHFGFRGLSLGEWLSQKLSHDYGMKCDYFELGLNSEEYYLTNKNPRKKILFYARPVTPRRGFELGVLALELFHKEHPEYEIHFLGWDIAPYRIPFPYVNHGVLSPKQLNELYNDCAAGLVLSFTNMSLLPLELLASGCRPVINDAACTRLVGYAEQLHYAAPTPRALADALYSSIKTSDAQSIESMSNCTKKFEWDDSNKKIERVLLKDLTGQ